MVGSRFVVVCGLLPAFLTAALAVYRPAFLAQLDYRVYDAMLRGAPASAANSRVAIVDIDERSLSTIGQWPWRREVIGQLVTRARELGASVVALDMVFAETDRYDASATTGSPSPDTALAAALRGGHVVLGYALTFDPAASRPTSCVLHPLTAPILESADGDAELALARASGAICSLPALAEAAGASGFLNAVPDADGILRRVPLLIEYKNRIHPGLALAAVLTATGNREVAIRMSTANATSLILDDRAVALDGKGNLLLRYRSGSRAFPYVSAADLLQGRLSSDALRNAVVFIGATALGAGDEVSTPFSTRSAGVEVQATVADNLLRQDFITRPEDALTIEIAAVLGLAVVIALLVARLGLAWGTVTGGVTLVLLWIGARWLLSAKGVYVSPLFPMGGLIVSLAAATIARLGHERVRADRAADEKDLARRLMVQSLLSLTEIRDAETGSHSRRTQQYSRLLADEVSHHPRFRDYLTPARIDLLASLAPLHDIGKVGVPDQLLSKPGALTAEEYGEMKKHPAYGLDVITRAELQAGARDDVTLALAKDIVYTHHERWDGRGYPRGLKGEQIPVAGRLIALVDVYDALTTNRRYRESITHDQAVDVIRAGSGTHFDPAVVDAFLRMAPLLRAVSTGIGTPVGEGRAAGAMS